MRTLPFKFFLFATLLLTASLRAADIGVNLEGNKDYARSNMFVDLVKSARRFGSPDTPWDEKCPTDKQLWPTTDAGLLLAADAPLAAGDYLFSFTGHADVSVSGATLKSSG